MNSIFNLKLLYFTKVNFHIDAHRSLFDWLKLETQWPIAERAKSTNVKNHLEEVMKINDKYLYFKCSV